MTTLSHRNAQFKGIFIALIAAAAALSAGAQAGTVPARITPSQVAAKVDEATHDLWYAPRKEYGSTTCRTLGKPLTFVCRVPHRKKEPGVPPGVANVWVKLRPSGGACVSTVSLAAVPAGCLRASAAIAAGSQDPGSDIRYATQKRLDPSRTGMFQGFTRLDCVGTDGWYQCSFGEGVKGSATVIYTRKGPLVRFTSWSVG